ncbi:MAG: alpha/beta hydrolase [Cyanobacteria bacterium]|nr:alpha/beta hydrolase [Cyanobacteriota bacterium]
MTSAALAAPHHYMPVPTAPSQPGFFGGVKNVLSSLLKDATSGLSNSKAVDRAVKLLHQAPALASSISPLVRSTTSPLLDFFNLEQRFFTGSVFAREALTLKHIQTIFKDIPDLNITTKLLRTEANRPPLTQFHITPAKAITSPLTILSGIRTSALYKSNGAKDLVRHGIPVSMSDYTGYGDTFGQATVHCKTLIADAIKMLKAQFANHSEVNLLGHSLGSAIGANAFAKLSATNPNFNSGNFICASGWNDFDSVCSELPQTTLRPFANMLRGYANKLFKNEWDTGANLCTTMDNIVKNITAKPAQPWTKFRIMIVHGIKDKLVSIKQAKKLQQTLEAHKATLPPNLQDHFEISFLTVQDAGHFNTKQGDIEIPFPEIRNALLAQNPSTAASPVLANTNKTA